ncbi:hydroxyacid oxidase 2 [Nematolebias whitei]|uniref:hydroxyacid oxidase 2 n=1 Tax=Nematolebias whitei TaxID=451745 RepID=UPI00189A1FCC|nr:hydroxyacid oxidase 2 [Nematolebias whitei]
MAMVCLTDFEDYAKEHLSKATWDYYAAGADECCTRDDNLLAYKRIRLRPRILRDVSMSDTRTTVQGTEINFPVGIAPTAFHCLAWHEGETATARAVSDADVSSSCCSQIDALAEIVDTVQGRIEVYLDGGIRTGSDVLKALALGARCVFIGRPAVWGLAYKGEEGLREVLQILNDEFRLSMALSGCRNVAEINRNLIQFSKL